MAVSVPVRSARTVRPWVEGRASRGPAPWSVPQREAVLARVRTAGQRATLAVDPDRLTAAVRLVDRPDPVAEAGERLTGLEADAAPDLALALEPEHPGEVDARPGDEGGVP